MFERFDEAARQALFFARIHTSLRHARTIDVDDLLQGLLTAALDDVSRFASDPTAVAALVAPALRRRDDEEKEALVERILRNMILDRDTAREVPFDAGTKAAMESAMAEADALGHAQIRAGHLLLGILRHEGTPAWQALMNAGVTLRGVREAMARNGERA